ncbi:MAG: LPP20 family lipoprotein [Methylococcales bacterium]|nr:LPP20 family lipoprotein [Methylococcales bacterium]
MIRDLCAGYIALVVVLSGCAQVAPAPVVVAEPVAKVLTVIGYGTIGRGQQQRLTPAQRKLMAIRASKLDAMRAMAEQVYGVRIQGHSSIEDMAVRDDRYRVFIDSYLRGARVVSSDAVDRDTYETVMELQLTPAFYQCLAGDVCPDRLPLQSNATSTVTPTSASTTPVTSAFPTRDVSPQRETGACQGGGCYGFPVTRGFTDQYSISYY